MVSRESAGGPVGTIAGWALRRRFPPGPGRGIQAFSRESPDAKSRGGGPPPPLFYGPLIGPRSFWRLLSRIRSRGYFLRDSKTDLERIFREKYAEKAFYERKSPNQGTYMGTVIAPAPGQCGTNAKTSERQQAGHKTGGPGGLPPALFLPISREKWGPPPGRRGPRGAAPQGRLPSHPPKGYLPPATDCLPHPPHKL